jgi:signal transduction histidine kinase
MGIKEPYKVIFNNLNRKKRELERLNEEKIQLFSIVAHDLRNPFNGLINSARFLHEDYEKLGEAEKRDFLEMLYASSKKLYSITENLLEWSRINLSSTQLSPVKIDLDEILSEAIDYFTLMLNHKGVSIRKENFEGCTVLADRGSLSIIFRNVLSNAIKFSYPNSVISINCLKSDDDIAIEFMDKGVGMSREKMEQLSGNLIKSSQGTSKEKGTGLGINIIKKHLELNEGEMEIFSEENIGTTVRILLKSGESI